MLQLRAPDSQRAVTGQSVNNPHSRVSKSGLAVEYRDSPRTSLEEIEHRQIISVLRHACNNISRAASILGIDRATLNSKTHRHRLWRDRSSDDAPSSPPEEA
jgi:DNA-binding protein Fis